MALSRKKDQSSVTKGNLSKLFMPGIVIAKNNSSKHNV